MSDGGRDRAALGVRAWKAYQEWSAQRTAVRSIDRLGGTRQHLSVNPSDQQYQSNEAKQNGKALYEYENIPPKLRTVWAEDDEFNARVEGQDEMQAEQRQRDRI